MSWFKRMFGKPSVAFDSTRAQTPSTPTQLSAVGLDPKAKVFLVRAFLVALEPRLVIGIQHEGKWYLPGGIVEGPGTPPGMPRGSHFEPLAWHLMEQTGLQLTGLSDGVGVGIFPGPNGPEVTVLYLGRAAGTQTGGTQFVLESLPEFAAICAVTPDQIRNLCSRF